MKTIEWDNPNNRFNVTATYPSTTLDICNPQAKPNMTVSAKFKGIDVHLKIIEEISLNRFKAIVTGFNDWTIVDGPTEIAEHPSKLLFENDEVIINQEDICSVSD